MPCFPLGMPQNVNYSYNIDCSTIPMNQALAQSRHPKPTELLNERLPVKEDVKLSQSFTRFLGRHQRTVLAACRRLKWRTMNSLYNTQLDLEIAWYWAMSKHQQSLRTSERRGLLASNNNNRRRETL